MPDDNEKGLEPSSSPQASFRDVPLRTCGCWSGPIYLLDNAADHEQPSLCTDTRFFSGPLVHEVRRHHPQSLSSHWLLCLLLPVSPHSDNSQVLQQDYAPWHLGFARRHHGGHLSFLPDNHLNLCPIFGKVPMKQSPLSLYIYKWSCHSSHQVVDPVLDHVTCFSQ